MISHTSRKYIARRGRGRTAKSRTYFFILIAAGIVAAFALLAPIAGLRTAEAQGSWSFTQISNLSEGTAHEPSINADGSRIAASVLDLGIPLYAEQIHLYNRSTGTNTQLSNAPIYAYSPSISGDGSRVAYTHSGDLAPSGQTPEHIYLYDSVLGTSGRISDIEGGGIYPSISANGNRIVYIQIIPGPSGHGYIVLYDLTTNIRTQLAAVENFYQAYPEINGDGTKIVFGSVKESGLTALMLHDTVTGTTTNLTGFGSHVSGSFLGITPSISDDGTRIAFTYLDNLTGQNADGSEEIFLYDAVAGSFTQITNSPTNSILPDISGNGNRIALASRADLAGGPPHPNPDVHELFVYDISSATFSEIDTFSIDPSGGADGPPSINHDGSLVAFNSGRNLTGENPDGSGETYVATWIQPSPTPTPTPTPSPTPTPTPCGVVNGDLTVVGAADTNVNLSCVTEVMGSVNVSGNTGAGSIDLSNLTTVSGGVDVSENSAAGTVDLGSLETVGGSVDVSDNTAAGTIDLGSLQSVTAGVAVSGNTSATSIDLGALQAVGGDVSVSGNSSATGIDLGEMNSVGGDVSIGDNTSASSIDVGGIETVPGDVSIGGNTAAGSIDLAGLQTVDGSVSITDNTAATVIDLSNLQAVGDGEPGVIGDLKVVDNKDCTQVLLGSLTSVERDMMIESCASGTFVIGNATVGRDARLNLTDYSSVAGLTAIGSTTITTLDGAATMTVALTAGSFNAPVSFQITRLDPALLLPEPGSSPGGPAVINPVTAYQFTFGVPTLNQSASLTFDIRLEGLDVLTRAALLQALSTGQVTLATKGDAPDSAYQSFPLCAAGEIPSPGGCVELQKLDANGEPTTGTPAILRFRNVVGHFSKWGVAIVVPDGPDNTFNGLLHPYPEQSSGIVPTIKRGSTFPIKFNWLSETGMVIDSALANPAVSIFPVSCASQQGTTSQIVVEDSGSSGGLRYDATSNSWIYNWSTRQVPAGCYSIRIASANSQFAGPSRSFPIALHR